MTRSALVTLLLFGLHLVACGSETMHGEHADAEQAPLDALSSPDIDRGAEDAQPDLNEPGQPEVNEPGLPCPRGQAQNESGACIPVGIQGCAEIFINPMTGLCEPGPDDCPPGHITDFSTGCTSVNISGCIDTFMNPETGLCDPKPEDCPPGHIPVFDEGCVRVGVIDCHPSFVDPVTGHCEVDPSLCGDHELPVPTQGCVSLDPPEGCGEAPFGNITPMSGDIFIDPSASASSANGSQGAPYPTLAQGLSAVNQGGRLVLASGTYPEALTINASISLIGRCSSMVTLTGPPTAGAFDNALIRIQGAHEVSMTNLSIAPKTIGMRASLGAQVTLDRVSIKDASDKGIVLTGSGTSLSASRLHVEGTLNVWDYSGYGIEVVSGATLTLRESALLDNTSSGVYTADLGSSALIRDVAIIGTMPEFDGWSGRGVWGLYGASVTLEESVLLDNYSGGLALLDAPSSAEVREVYIARTKYASFGFTYAVGIELSGAVNLTLDSAVVRENQGAGMISFDNATTHASNLLASHNQLDETNSFGNGLVLQSGSSITLERSALVGNHTAGISVAQLGSEAELYDVLITQTKSSPADLDGIGAVASFDAAMRLERCVLSDNRNAGISVDQSGEKVTLRDIIVTRTSASASGNGGMGLIAQKQASISLQRGAIVANQAAGVFARGAQTRLALSETLIAETKQSPMGGNGFAIGARGGAYLSVENATLRDSFYASAAIFEEGTEANFEGVLLTKTRPSDADIADGLGLLSGAGATTTMTQSAVVDHVEMGVDVTQATMDLSYSIISQIKPGTDDKYGDGLIAVQQSVAHLHGVVSKDNARAGFFFGDSGGSVSQCLAQANTLGLVTHGAHASASLEVADDNITIDNDQNRVTDQALAIPDIAIETPSL